MPRFLPTAGVGAVGHTFTQNKQFIQENQGQVQGVEDELEVDQVGRIEPGRDLRRGRLQRHEEEGEEVLQENEKDQGRGEGPGRGLVGGRRRFLVVQLGFWSELGFRQLCIEFWILPRIFGLRVTLLPLGTVINMEETNSSLSESIRICYIMCVSSYMQIVNTHPRRRTI